MQIKTTELSNSIAYNIHDIRVISSGIMELLVI